MLTASALALLAACGGGYDSGDDAPVTPVTPVTPVIASGTVTTLGGTPSSNGSADGTGAAALFDTPRAVAVDSSGNVYVADSANSTIRKITPAGVVTTLAGVAGLTGNQDGTGTAARFGSGSRDDDNVVGPEGIAFDASGNVLYVADGANNVIRKITLDGVVTTLAGTFNGVQKLAVDASGNLYVPNNAVVLKITPVGEVTTLAGTAGEYGYTDSADGPPVRFGGFSGIAVDSDGNVYVSDPDYSTIRKITPAGVVTTTLAGTPGAAMGTAGFSNGTGTTAKFSNPQGVAVDASGNVFVADFNNQSIRKITPDGVVTTFAGGPENFTPGDGVGVGIPMPSGIAVGADGYIYFVTEANTVGKIKP